MRIEDIRDVRLRAWVTDYVQRTAEEARANKGSIETLRAIWRTRSEEEWGALRELIPLRERVRALDLESEVQRLIGKRIDSLPPVERNGIAYRAPHSLGLEVAVLKELLGARAPVERSTVHVEELLFDDAEHRGNHDREH